MTDTTTDNTTDDAIIQAVAADLWPFISRHILPKTKGVAFRHLESGSTARASALEVARLTLLSVYEALDKAGPLGTGLTVVPKATMTMGQIEAGVAAIADIDLSSAVKDRIVQRVYFAAVAASPKAPGAEP